MARRQLVVRGGVSRGVRRKTQWGSSADVTASIAIGPQVALLTQDLSGAALASVVPATIVRTRGELWVRSDQVAAVEEPFGALGFSVVTEAARAVGVAAVPIPITDEGADVFFVHQFWQCGAVETGAVQEAPWSRYSFDSKAMRKITDGEAVVVTMENASAVGLADFILKFRMLFKLH